MVHSSQSSVFRRQEKVISMNDTKQDEHFWRDRNVFVTGGTGFLGSWITQALIDKGAHVVGLVRDQVADSRLFRAGLAERMSIVYGALEDYATINRTIAEYEIGTVFHRGAGHRRRG
jgi:CDP-glucose 4,6-dehydratase